MGVTQKTRLRAGVYHIDIDNTRFIVKRKQNMWHVSLHFTTTNIMPLPVLYDRTLKSTIRKIERFAAGYNARHAKEKQA